MLSYRYPYYGSFDETPNSFSGFMQKFKEVLEKDQNFIREYENAKTKALVIFAVDSKTFCNEDKLLEAYSAISTLISAFFDPLDDCIKAIGKLHQDKQTDCVHELSEFLDSSFGIVNYMLAGLYTLRDKLRKYQKPKLSSAELMNSIVVIDLSKARYDESSTSYTSLSLKNSLQNRLGQDSLRQAVKEQLGQSRQTAKLKR